MWSFHILRNLIKVNGNVVVAPSNEVFCVENEPYAVAKISAQGVEQSGRFGGSNILEPKNFIFNILERNEKKKL